MQAAPLALVSAGMLVGEAPPDPRNIRWTHTQPLLLLTGLLVFFWAVPWSPAMLVLPGLPPPPWPWSTAGHLHRVPMSNSNGLLPCDWLMTCVCQRIGGFWIGGFSWVLLTTVLQRLVLFGFYNPAVTLDCCLFNPIYFHVPLLLSVFSRFYLSPLFTSAWIFLMSWQWGISHLFRL